MPSNHKNSVILWGKKKKKKQKKEKVGGESFFTFTCEQKVLEKNEITLDQIDEMYLLF